MSEEQQIRVFVDTLLCLFKDGLSRPILTTYKQTYSGANYMWHVRNALKSDNYTFNAAIFKNEAVLLSQLEPYGWLRLMRRQWRLFQGKLGKAGKKHLDALYDIRNKWAHHDEITVENAIAAAEAAIFLLDAYGAKEVAEVRDAHRALMDLQIRQAMPENLPRVTQEASADMDLNILPPFKPSPPANGLDGATIGAEPIVMEGRFCIQIIEPENQPRTEYLPENFQQLIVGRSSDCGIQINDGQASRAHLMLEPGNKNSIILTDLTSRNGTYLRGVRLPDSQPVRWFVGQQIYVGKTLLILRYDTDL